MSGSGVEVSTECRARAQVTSTTSSSTCPPVRDRWFLGCSLGTASTWSTSSRWPTAGRPQLEPWLDTSTPDPDTIPTLPRHYPDTIPTPRHSDTSVNRHSVRHSDTSVRPVSSHLDVGHPRMASRSVNGVKAKPTLRHSTPPTPPTPRHSTPPTLRHYRPRC